MKKKNYLPKLARRQQTIDINGTTISELDFNGLFI